LGEGIRVNAISAGPIKTLAARGIANFGDMLKPKLDAPAERNVDGAESARPAAFLASEAGSGIRRDDLRRLR